MSDDIDIKDNVPFESQRAMATTALLTQIWKEYLDANVCSLMNSPSTDDNNQFASEILDHVIIVGGFPRDILLNRTINDIDIIINLRELGKLQSNHLNKYHSKKDDQDHNTQCIYWQTYLQKLINDQSNINDQQRQNNEMIAMHNYNYILNSKFWLKILKKNKNLLNKISIKDVPNDGYTSCQIVNTVNYGNINLDGQLIDFIDTFHPDKCFQEEQNIDKFAQFHRKSRQLSISGLNIDKAQLDIDNNDLDLGLDDNDDNKQNKSRPELQHKQKANKAFRRGRLKSMALMEFDIDDMGATFGDFGADGFGFKSKDDDNDNDNDNDADKTKSRPEYISIEVPVYSGKVRYKLLYYDFSINTAIIPFSNVIKLQDFNNNNTDNDKPMTWYDIIENGLGECDAIQDCTVNKIIRTPENDHEDGTIEAHPIAYHFWRIVRWRIREATFSIDDDLIAGHIRDYPNWLNIDRFTDNAKCSRFMKQLKYTLTHECKSITDVSQMLSTMDELKFNQLFIKLVDDEQSVRHLLVDTIGDLKNNNITNSEVTDLFKEYGYQIEEQLFKIPSKTQQDINKLTIRKQFLESELNDKKARIKDLEQQNDRLLKEIRMLKELNQKNDKAKELEKANSKLLLSLQALNESKMKLAVNANNTIDKLRNYLVQYQNIILKLDNK